MPLYNPASSIDNPLPGLLSEVQYETSDGDSSTTSATYQTKLTLTTPALVGGDYALWWYIQAQTSGANKNFHLQILDGVSQIAYYQARYSRAAHQIPFSGVITLPSVSATTVKTFTMQYARITNTTLTVSKARFIFFRLQ